MDKMSLPLAYAMKKKSAHMCHGGDCAHPSHKMAEGGDASPAIGKLMETGTQDPYSNEELDKEMSPSSASKYLKPGSELVGQVDSYAGGGSVKSRHARALRAFYGKRMAEGGMMTTDGYQSKSKPEIDGDLMPEAHLKQELAEHVAHEPTHDSMVEHDVMNQMGDEDEGAGDMDSINPMVMRIIMGLAKGYSEGGQVANEESGESTDEPTMAKASGNEVDDLALRDDLEFKSTGANAGDENDDAQENHDREDMVSRIIRSRSKKDRMSVPGEGSTYGKGK